MSGPEIVITVATAVRAVARVAKFAITLLESAPQHPFERLQSISTEELDAIDNTLEEWLNIVSGGSELMNFMGQTTSPTDMAQHDTSHDAARLRRIRALANVEGLLLGTQPMNNKVSIRTAHSRLISSTNDGLKLRLGESSATTTLRNIVLDMTPMQGSEEVKMHEFKITMIGGTGSGKTVYMAAMYTALSAGIGNLRMRARDPQTDHTLRGIYQNIAFAGEYPLGTLESVTYDFELLVRGKSVATVDWVDYRGGDLAVGAAFERSEELATRIRESDAVIWMVDMAKVTAFRKRSSQTARERTGIGRYSAICSEAMAGRSRPMAWVFVGTKCDVVRSARGDIDVKRAVEELVEHLGETAKITQLGSYTRGAVAVVSALGDDAAKLGQSDYEGSPQYCECPFVLCLVALLQGTFDNLMAEADDLGRKLLTANAFGDFLKLISGSSNTRTNNSRTLSQINRGLLQYDDVLKEMAKSFPKEFRLL